MTTINTAEIEARLADMITNGVTVTATGDLEISDDLLATLAATEAALKAETARAEKAELERDKWQKLHSEARLSDMNHNYNPFTDHR